MIQEVSSLAESLDKAEYIPLLNHENKYEILNYYPFTIRNKSNGKIVKITKRPDGYYIVWLGKTYLLHRIIALQFLKNEDPIANEFIDHIDRNRSNYNLENLKWCTCSENNKNKSSNKGVKYEFINEIPDDSIRVTEYGTHKLDNIFYHNDKFYFYNGINYRTLHINEDKLGYRFVKIKDIDNKSVPIYYTVFKQKYLNE